MASSLSISELVEKLQNAKTKNERIELLKNNDSLALRGLLRMNFDSSLTLDLPAGIPPFKVNSAPVGMGDTTLKASAKGWYVFSKKLSPNLKQSKRESIFINLLERLDSKESKILLDAKDKKLDLGITKKIINEVFPGLIHTESKTDGNKEEPTKTAPSTTDQGNGEVV
jgi:hypothetical protein